jgi:hypothetical protein
MRDAPMNEVLANACAEGGGLWRLVLLGGQHADALAAAVQDGEPSACRLARVLAAFRDRLDAHATLSDDTAPTCLLCPRILWRAHYPLLVGVLTADVAAPDATCVCGICQDCWVTRGDDPTLRTAILASLRDRYGLELRVLLHAPGCA